MKPQRLDGGVVPDADRAGAGLQSDGGDQRGFTGDEDIGMVGRGLTGSLSVLHGTLL